MKKVNVETFAQIIKQGNYQDFEKLPSVSFFCKKYHLSHVTLKKYFKTLINRGLIINLERKRYYVTPQKMWDNDAISITILNNHKLDQEYLQNKIIHLSKNASSPTFNNQPTFTYLRKRQSADNLKLFEQTEMPLSYLAIIENNPPSIFQALIKKQVTPLISIITYYPYIFTQADAQKWAERFYDQIPAFKYVQEVYDTSFQKIQITYGIRFKELKLFDKIIE